MDLIEVWHSGQNTVIQALEHATQGELATELFDGLDSIERELQRQFWAQVSFDNRRTVDASSWTPWYVAGVAWIRSGQDLKFACTQCLPATSTTPNWDSLAAFAKRSEAWLLDLIIASNYVLTANDVGLLDEMLRIQATADSPKSLRTILTLLGWPTEGKHAFDNLKKVGYVLAKPGPSGGFYLTEAGISRATRLR